MFPREGVWSILPTMLSFANVVFFFMRDLGLSAFLRMLLMNLLSLSVGDIFKLSEFLSALSVGLFDLVALTESLLCWVS